MRNILEKLSQYEGILAGRVYNLAQISIGIKPLKERRKTVVIRFLLPRFIQNHDPDMMSAFLAHCSLIQCRVVRPFSSDSVGSRDS